jgi:hypothetical protein
VFYLETNDAALRFGDILRGYVATIPKIKEPNLHTAGVSAGCDIIVSYFDFVVVMSPCCSIKEKIICLAPLIKLEATLFRNPFLRDDPTKINLKMNPQQCWIPEQWEKLPENKKQEELSKGLSYAFLSFFIYNQHQILPRYSGHIKEIQFETGCYMIDFRMIYSLNCEKIINPKQAPLESKCLQLSIQTRSELRDKIDEFVKT